MAFVAISRLRFGDAWLEPGDAVPIEPGRNYALMAQVGEIQHVPERTELAGEDGQPEDLSALKRGELNARALELGIADAGTLPNKQAVIGAIEQAQAAADAAGDGSE